MQDGSRSARTRDHKEEDFGGETSGVCNNGKYPPGEAPPVLYSQDQHNSGQVHRGGSGSMETLGNSVLKAVKGEDPADASIKHERYGG